jgi:oxygen-independent coproporphyrinogen-3 oxidase
MELARQAQLDRRVPRYTSYPTAPHMHPGVGAATYANWLERIAPGTSLSLYLHIPFCDTLCWFCGCHTKIVARYDPIAAYLRLLRTEIARVAKLVGRARPVTHVHLGGGSPTILSADDLIDLGDHLHRCFDVRTDAEIAVEIDPRGLDRGRIEALARFGVTRASLGVQDLDPEVQAAINRLQPFETTARVAGWLREVGIEALNLDLMYGLPGQSVAGVARTVEAVLALAPARLALFGYAHVPWMKRHQRLIDEAALPDAADRLRQFEAMSDRLRDAGYVPIGLDHVARPDDELAVAARERRLHRNFQGYTTDDAPVLLGFGASAIGALPRGYVQNATPIHGWRDAIAGGDLGTMRGIEIDDEDRLRRAVIEQLMCHLEVQLTPLCRHHGRPPDHFAAELASLGPLVDEGLVTIQSDRLTIHEKARPLVRLVAAAFDGYLQTDETRHAKAV